MHRYEDIRPHGPSTDALDALYLRAASKRSVPITFELTSDLDAARFDPNRTRIWLKRGADGLPDPYAIAHELAHVIIAYEQNSPRIHPEFPATLTERQVLSDLIYISEHVLLHELLHEYPIVGDDHNDDRNVRFLSDIATAPTRSGGNLHLSIGHAMMLAVCPDVAYTDRVNEAMRAKAPQAAELGLRLAGYVMSPRETTLTQDAHELMRIANIIQYVGSYVFSPIQFRAHFGWS